ncbi:MAG: glutamate--tRNA ligase [Patescibacteria group bacterium]|nr:glutamate--tRNA ligase [Patescibacteria group bacterium]
MTIKTRFAPSPTGYLHIGGLRTALYNYLFTKKNKGKFILRIEDTDRTRYVKDADKQLVNTIKTFGLNFDKGPIYQSKRLKIYKKYADLLVKEKKAYYCFCTKERLDDLRESQEKNKQVPKYDRRCLNLSDEEIAKKLKEKVPYVIRMKLPDNEIITFNDLVYGEVKINTNDLDDQVLIKSDGFPTYHLAVVVDDHDMDITHVIRGEEWLPSTPNHILLYKMFNWSVPNFAHLPLLLNQDRSKLSKRQGDVAAEDFIKKGYLPQALINYVAFLGWNPKTEKEIYSMSELINDFEIPKINKAGAVFDINKLNWINATYIRNIVENKKIHQKDYKYILNFIKNILPNTNRAEDILQIFSPRLNSIIELKELSKFIFELPNYDKNLLIFKKSNIDLTKNGLNVAIQILNQIEDKNWDQENLNSVLNNALKEKNLAPGDVFWPIRVALSGLEKSPSPTEILYLLRKTESLKRINTAIEKLK